MLIVGNRQQDATLCSAPRGTTWGPSISLDKGGLLSERCHSAMHRARKGHLWCPTACGLSLLCQVPVLFCVLSAWDCESLEESPLLHSAEHRRGLPAPGFLGAKLSNYKLLLSFFWQFRAEVLLLVKAKGQWLIQNLYFPQNCGMGK